MCLSHTVCLWDIITYFRKFNNVTWPWTRPLWRWFNMLRLELTMIHLHTRFEVPSVIRSKDRRGVPKFKEISSCWGGRPFGYNRHGPKSGEGCCTAFRGGAGSPSNTMWPGPRPTSVLLELTVLTHSSPQIRQWSYLLYVKAPRW